MLDHISLGVTDLQRSIRFYVAVLAPLGYRRLWSDSDAAGYGVPGHDEPFAIKRQARDKAELNSRLHIAFHASSRTAVVQFYEAAVSLGAATDGGPELHPMYGDNYFASFIGDPDGHRLEAVCHAAQIQPRFTLDHVQIAIPAGQEDLARSFYVAILGFHEIEKPSELAKRGGAWFRAGGVSLHLGVEETFVPAKKAHPALCCPDYDSLMERFAGHAIIVTHDPLSFEGKRHCYVTDPFGNRIEIIDDAYA